MPHADCVANGAQSQSQSQSQLALPRPPALPCLAAVYILQATPTRLHTRPAERRRYSKTKTHSIIVPFFAWANLVSGLVRSSARRYIITHLCPPVAVVNNCGAPCSFCDPPSPPETPYIFLPSIPQRLYDEHNNSRAFGFAVAPSLTLTFWTVVSVAALPLD